MRSTRHSAIRARSGAPRTTRLTASLATVSLAAAVLVGGAGAAGAAPATSAAATGVPTASVPTATDPTTALRTYVTAVYGDLFDRKPDTAGLNSWTSSLLSGTPRVAVANAITASGEFRSGLISDSYQTYLGRTPEGTGAANWLVQLNRGVTQQDMEAGFLASDEYFTASGRNPASWVSRLYKHVLNRSAAPSEVSHWTKQLAAGANRKSVALGFLLSSEHLGTVVDAYYRNLLDRSIDLTGRATWVGSIQRGVRLEAVIGSVVSSNEYVNSNGGQVTIAAPAPAAAPTATPTAVQVSGSTPGWLRTASNTGLAAVGTTSAMLTKYSGSLTVTGRLYRQRIDLGSSQLVLAQGAVLEECLVTGTRNGGQGQVRITGAGVQILNSDIVGSASSSGESMGIFSDNLNAARISSVRMTGFTIFLWLDSSSSASTPVSVIDGFYGYDQISVRRTTTG